MTTKRKKVFILTNSRDEHAHLIIPQIEKFHGRVYRLDTDRFSTHFFIFSDIQKKIFHLKTPVGEISSSEIDSLWLRRPLQVFTEAQSSNLQQQLIRQELSAVIRSLPEFLKPTSLIVDRPERIRQASQKIKQLLVAQKLGLKIPKTIITNSPQKAKYFLNQLKNNVVVKTIDKAFVADQQKSVSIYTSKVEKNDKFNLIRNCPTLFQEEIRKKTELRITIIGRKIFAVEFESQKLPEARIDWRKAGEKIKTVPHRVVKLPEEINNKLLSLLDYFGLNFGAIDMAKTFSDEYIFFEINPAGQFLWLEGITGLPLASEMAKFLTGISK